MLKIPSSPNKIKNADMGGDDSLCVVCDRPIRTKNPKMLRRFYGQYAYTEEETAKFYSENPAEASRADLLFYPVGNGCLLRHPELLPYTKPFSREIPEAKPIDRTNEPSKPERIAAQLQNQQGTAASTPAQPNREAAATEE